MENIRFEVFMSKLALKGKDGIRLPLKEKESEKHIVMLKQLLQKGMISGEGYDKKVKELNSCSLDEELYKEFCELIAEKV